MDFGHDRIRLLDRDVLRDEDVHDHVGLAGADDLRPQIDLAFELCQAYGIPAIQIEGYEADDVLGTLAVQAVKQGLKVVIVTGDKDLLQLVSDSVKVYDPMKDILYDADTVQSSKGIKPEQVIDWLGFQGDASDN